MADEVQTLQYPESIVIRKLPLNLLTENYSLFEGELQRTIPRTTILELTDVRISPEGILFRGYEMLPDSFAFAWNLKQWKLRSYAKFYVENYFLRKTRNIEAKVLWVTDNWSSAYFHWLTDVLSRLYVVRERLHDLLVVLPHGYENLEFVHSTLRCFDVRSLKFIGANEVLRCRKVIMPSHTAPSGHYNEEIIRGVRQVIREAYGDHNYKGQGARIYISRSRASKRRIHNEEEVLALMRAYDFQIVCSEDLPFEEQVRLCSRARYLVSNHGAGLTNMLFLSEGASVLELRHHADRTNNCYFTLSSALNFNYFYQTCQTAPGYDDTHLADLVVDVDLFEQNLRLFLASAS